MQREIRFLLYLKCELGDYLVDVDAVNSANCLKSIIKDLLSIISRGFTTTDHINISATIRKSRESWPEIG